MSRESQNKAMVRGMLKKARMRSCRICKKRFDTMGWTGTTMCDNCYGTVPVETEYCDNVCKGKPRAFICYKRCKCPTHAPIENLDSLLRGK